MKRSEFEFVEVEWIDAQSSLDFLYVDSIKAGKLKLETTRSAGYLIHKGKDYILLGFMMFGGDVIKHYQIIPKGMIKSMRSVWKKEGKK